MIDFLITFVIAFGGMIAILLAFVASTSLVIFVYEVLEDRFGDTVAGIISVLLGLAILSALIASPELIGGETPLISH